MGERVVLPLLRHGMVYESVEVAPVPQVAPGGVEAAVSQANAGLIRRDRRRAEAGHRALRALSTAEILARTADAARRFVEDELTPGPPRLADWARAVSRSTGLPEALARRHGERLAGLLANQEQVLRGLMRGLEPSILDTGRGVAGGVEVALVQTARSLAVVLPSNSPAVNGLWLAAPALRLPVTLKPGRGDPWTPYRLVAALVAAGLPAEAFGVYGADHDGAAAMIEVHDRVMVFGGADTVARYAQDRRVEVHGPGFSKIVVGEDWRPHLPPIVESVAYNGGRSCINASTILTDRDADGLAEALASALGGLRPTALDDPSAALASTEPGVAEPMMARVREALGGARLVCGGEVWSAHGLSWLAPTVVRCGIDHPLARTELPFPFVSVVEVPRAALASSMGPTLSCMVLGDAALQAEVLDRPEVDRVHLGSTPTSRIRWDQPHEGNLFEATWRRRGVG